MKIVGSNRNVRTVYAGRTGDEFYLSPFPEARNGRRPVARFDSREELEAHAASRNCEVEWQEA